MSAVELLSPKLNIKNISMPERINIIEENSLPGQLNIELRQTFLSDLEKKIKTISSENLLDFTFCLSLVLPESLTFLNTNNYYNTKIKRILEGSEFNSNNKTPEAFSQLAKLQIAHPGILNRYYSLTDDDRKKSAELLRSPNNTIDGFLKQAFAHSILFKKITEDILANTWDKVKFSNSIYFREINHNKLDDFNADFGNFEKIAFIKLLFPQKYKDKNFISKFENQLNYFIKDVESKPFFERRIKLAAYCKLIYSDEAEITDNGKIYFVNIPQVLAPKPTGPLPLERSFI